MTDRPESIVDLLAACAKAAARHAEGHSEPGYILDRHTIARNPAWFDRVVHPALSSRLVEAIQYADGRWLSLRILPPGEKLLADVAKQSDRTPPATDPERALTEWRDARQATQGEEIPKEILDRVLFTEAPPRSVQEICRDAAWVIEAREELWGDPASAGEPPTTPKPVRTV